MAATAAVRAPTRTGATGRSARTSATAGPLRRLKAQGFSDQRLAQGYAAVNSNTGHDTGSEPGASFGFNNRQAEIDFGHRAVHLTAVAAKAVVDAYYGRSPEYSYFEGCSTGGREGLMEAQRYPYDFDGIVAGAPAHLYQDLPR